MQCSHTFSLDIRASSCAISTASSSRRKVKIPVQFRTVVVLVVSLTRLRLKYVAKTPAPSFLQRRRVIRRKESLWQFLKTLRWRVGLGSRWFASGTHGSKSVASTKPSSSNSDLAWSITCMPCKLSYHCLTAAATARTTPWPRLEESQVSLRQIGKFFGTGERILGC